MSLNKSKRIFVSLGSNVGNRIQNIRSAVAELRKICHIKRTSFLYESIPAYFHDQPNFFNGVIEVQLKSTDLQRTSAQQFLTQLQHIESKINRSKISTQNYKSQLKNGPRAIDLDILFYRDENINNNTNLHLPHPKIQERHFVLRPLCDIDPNFIHPLYKCSVAELQKRLTSLDLNEVSRDKSEDIYKAKVGKREYCIRKFQPVDCDDKASLSSPRFVQNKRTYLMAILNVTPDSFSDGGQFLTSQEAVDAALSMYKQGADIIDIGGMSTRPSSNPVTSTEELDRTIPVIEHLHRLNPEIPISIDTYRKEVAREAVNAGAHIVNDVSCASHDNGSILETVRDLSVPYIAMHMRGTPLTMQSLTDYSNFVLDLRKEISNLLTRCLDAGIPLQDIVIDPGIGFSKTAEQCFVILRKYRELLPRQDLPSLSGFSRKSFMKNYLFDLNSEAKDRKQGSAAACAASIAGGANIIRVHDVREMLDVMKISDQIQPKIRDF